MLRFQITFSLVLAAFTLTGFVETTSAQAQKPFRIEQRWTIGGTGGWDYMTVDSEAHRLYIAHQTRVDVVDINTGKVIGAVQGLTRTHGVVISPDGKTGFVSDGGANNVVVFDPSNFATLATIPAGTNPDGMVYERATNTLWAFNGTSKNATIIDATRRAVVGTTALPGKPEFPTTDDKGTVFVNIEDKNEIIRLDANTKSVTATWPLAGCESPSGMAIDLTGRRLFSVCDGKKMAVTDANSGKVIATPTIGDSPDAAGYDAAHKLAFSSNGDGTLTIIDASNSSFNVLQTLKTQRGARTMAFDPATGRVYLTAAEYGPVPAPTPGAPRTRPVPVPGSFSVLVVGR
jgi:YVTN family beta-propeller protein